MKGIAKVIGLVCVCLAGPALAQDTASPRPYPEVTFKKVGVPKAGSKRITVQIREGEGVLTTTPGAEQKPADSIARPLSGYDWYWEVVPFTIDQDASRLTKALSGLDKAPTPVPAPRLEDMHRIASVHGVDILMATIGTKVSPALVLAVIGVESSGRTAAVSHAGAQGLMQLMPDTATRFGVADATVPSDNIRGGVKYLDWLLTEFGGDPVLALAGYNAGENSVKTHAGVPPFAETRAYVPKVLAAWRVARGLCVTPPELISDGCVFAKKGAPSNG